MTRTREIADNPQKGKIRYDLYKAVIHRYKEAMEKGFFLEAITLMESLISDRLESAINFYGLRPKGSDFRPLGETIPKSRFCRPYIG